MIAESMLKLAEHNSITTLMIGLQNLKNEHDSNEEEARIQALNTHCKTQFQNLVQQSQYVGDVFSMSFDTALVLVHDRFRMNVGGIPSLSFLIATRADTRGLEQMERADPKRPLYEREDASVLLLRVMDAAPLPNDREATQIRVQTAQSMNSPESDNWDSPEGMDGATAHLLSYAGLKCRVIGTFYLEQTKQNTQELAIKFGSDISNFYPNRGLKVYKPNSTALGLIVNYRDPLRDAEHQLTPEVTIGTIRYASTNRAFQGVSDVAACISPADLKSQKTAVFGMTRTGKSNTIKTIIKSVFDLRTQLNNPQLIGQLVFDVNGEYANENTQDKSGADLPDALKNIWKIHGAYYESHVVTYGIAQHPNDPNRILMKLNFHEEDNLQMGKEIINSALTADNVKFIQNFIQVEFIKPESSDKGATTRYKRRVLAYRALLVKAGLSTNIQPDITGLFNADLLKAMNDHSIEDSKYPAYRSAASAFSNKNVTWAHLSTAFESLYAFMTGSGKASYNTFEMKYINNTGGSGDAWADDDFKKILEMFSRSNGSRQIGEIAPQHTAQTSSDYAKDIYQHLVEGKLVIIDQSSGDYLINKSSAERVVQKVFNENQALFRKGHINLPEIIFYVEEAHNLLPADSSTDLKNIWVRTAKEGAKYRIGMVYATQEVSSIQKNILKNTSNWFIGHLNNTDETKELKKYYDFADFESSILRAQDKGFLRIKTLSNPYVIPAQIKRFELSATAEQS